MEATSTLHRNPSRETCEKTIRRILEAEISQKGTNSHFKNASDFMSYFESLYPASDALTKQVQRAVKALNMPKDEHGYYIPNKTAEQFQQEKELMSLFEKGHVSLVSLDNATPIFLLAEEPMKDYLINQITQAKCLNNLIVTITKTYNGILIYTNDEQKMIDALNSLII